LQMKRHAKSSVRAIAQSTGRRAQGRPRPPAAAFESSLLDVFPCRLSRRTTCLGALFPRTNGPSLHRPSTRRTQDGSTVGGVWFGAWLSSSVPPGDPRPAPPTPRRPSLLPDDFDGTDHLLRVDRTSLALAHARAGTQPAVPTDRDPDEVLAQGRRLLRGDPEDCAGI
jgi:hypothetical protein